jgi:NAD dependent epimerase/dehydratase family enzyme
MDLSKATGAVPFFDDGLQWMSVIHRDDCATLMRWVAEQRFSGRICNLVAGEPLRHATFVEHLAQELALSIRRVPSRILRRRFDRASEVAVASSIRLRSLYAKEMSTVALRFRDPLKALRSVVAERRGRTRPATTAASG